MHLSYTSSWEAYGTCAYQNERIDLERRPESHNEVATQERGGGNSQENDKAGPGGLAILFGIGEHWDIQGIAKIMKTLLMPDVFDDAESILRRVWEKKQ